MTDKCENDLYHGDEEEQSFDRDEYQHNEDVAYEALAQARVDAGDEDIRNHTPVVHTRWPAKK
jgi:hypothetical protein